MKTINLYHISENDLRLIVDCLKFSRVSFCEITDTDYLLFIRLCSSLRESGSSISRLISRLENRL